MHDMRPSDTDTDVSDADWGARPVKQAAKFIGVSPATAWRLIKAGELKKTRVGGRTVVRRVDALDFLARKYAETNPDTAGVAA